MGLDFSKISNAMTTFSKSPAARKQNKYGIQEALLVKDLQEQKRANELASYSATAAAMQETSSIAQKLGVREKDIPLLSQKVQGVGTRISDKIKNDFGGNLDHFYRSIGPEFLHSLNLELFNDPEVRAISQNVSEYAKFIDLQTKGKPLFNRQVEEEAAFRAGEGDTFDFGLAMVDWESPSEGFLNDHIGEDRVDVYLGFGNNMQIALQNIKREYRLTPEQLEDVTTEDIRVYTNKYVGAQDGFSKIRGNASNKSKIANTLNSAMANMGTIDANKINLFNKDAAYQGKLKPFYELGLIEDRELDGVNVKGKAMFTENLTQLVEAYFETAMDYSNDGLLLGPDGATVEIGQLSDADGGGLYDETGIKMEGATYNDSFRILGGIMAYKTLDNGKLIMKDEMTEELEGRVKSTIVVAMQNDGYALGGDTFGWGQETIYKEIDFSNPIKAEKLNNLIKFDEEQYNKDLSETGEALKESKENVTFADINYNSKPKRLKEFAAYHDETLRQSFNSLGINEPSLKMRSIMLAISLQSGKGEEGQARYLKEVYKMYNSTDNPAAHSALRRDDAEGFLKALIEDFEVKGISTPEDLEQFKIVIQETATSIHNSIKE